MGEITIPTPSSHFTVLEDFRAGGSTPGTLTLTVPPQLPRRRIWLRADLSPLIGSAKWFGVIQFKIGGRVITEVPYRVSSGVQFCIGSSPVLNWVETGGPNTLVWKINTGTEVVIVPFEIDVACNEIVFQGTDVVDGGNTHRQMIACLSQTLN